MHRHSREWEFKPRFTVDIKRELLTGQKSAALNVQQICAAGPNQPQASGFFPGLYRIEQENTVNIYLLTLPILGQNHESIWILIDVSELLFLMMMTEDPPEYHLPAFHDPYPHTFS